MKAFERKGVADVINFIRTLEAASETVLSNLPIDLFKDSSQAGEDLESPSSH